MRSYTTNFIDQPMLATDAKLGCAFFGTQGTGKTSHLEGMLRDAVRNMQKVLAVDFEGGLAHRLQEVAQSGYEVHRIDVTVNGGVGLDLPAMMKRHSDVLRWARKLAPVRGHANDYFDAMAQEVLIATNSYCKKWAAPGAVKAGDAIRLFDELPLMAALQDFATEIRNPFRISGTKGRSARDVQTTVVTKLRPLMTFAALTEKATHLIDPLDIVHGKKPMAIVLVFKDRYRDVLEKVYSFVIDTVIEEKLSITDRDSEPLHVVLDELGSLAKLETLPDLVRRSRKATLCYYYAVQSIEQVIRRYGREDGQDILDLPAFKAFFKLPGKRSAEWASGHLGAREVLRDIEPRQYGALTKEGLQSIRTVVEVMNAPWYLISKLSLASFEKDESFGYIDVPSITRQFTAKFRHKVTTKTPPPKFTEVPTDWEILGEWTPADKAIRLNFPAKALQKAARKKKGGRRP